MDVERWGRAQSIFIRAIDLPKERQRSFVEEMCGGDLEITGQVLDLLEEDARQQPMLDGDPGGTLAHVADAVLHVDQIRSLVERQIGPYRLQRVLGEGGMGIVYLAERTDIGGLVAIKLLRDAWMSPIRRGRFIVEQQTLVKLNHPSIARLYDASTMEDGTPWFVMEYVDGQPLTEYLCARAAGVREDLLLFGRVCEAVRYAHSRAIVHRDLKPSNIYVTQDGEVKLLDFGIAKELTLEASRGEHTIAGFRLLSRDYAAPEQFSGGEVGVFTDVYTLGVLLYEILTGHPPECAEDRGDKPLHRPSSIVRKGGDAAGMPLGKQQWTDLDVLCMTALQVEPERRYRSVDAMLRDLTAFLDGRVLEARSPSLVYTAGKFARRHRPTLIGLAATLLVLAGAGTYFTVRLAHSRDAAVAEAARTARIQKFMLEMIGDGDEEAGPASDLRVSTLLDREAKEAASLNADAETQIDLYQTLGTMYNRLGKYDESGKMLSLALKRAKQSTGENSAKVATILVQMGALHGDEGDLKNAQSEMQQAMGMMARAHPGQEDAAAVQAKIGMGRIYIQSGDPQKAVDLLTPLASRDQKQKGVQAEDVRDAVAILAVADLGAHHYDRAEADGEKAIALDRQLLGDSHPQTGVDIANLASVKSVQGDFPEAEHLYREGRSIMLAWYGPDHPDVATLSSILARILDLEGKDEEAEPLLLDALRIQEKAYGPVHERVAYTLGTLGEVAFRRHDLASAEFDFQRELAIDQSLVGDSNYVTAAVRANLGMVYLKESRDVLAEATLHKAVDVLALLPPGNNLIGTARGRWGSALLALKQYGPAGTQLTLAQHLLAAQQGASPLEIANVQNDLAALSIAVNPPGDRKIRTANTSERSSHH
jgi:serine/threonine-protein kinase